MSIFLVIKKYGQTHNSSLIFFSSVLLDRNKESDVTLAVVTP